MTRLHIILTWPWPDGSESWFEFVALRDLPESVCLPLMQAVWALRLDYIDSACVPVIPF